jgi:hypothetical protein
MTVDKKPSDLTILADSLAFTTALQQKQRSASLPGLAITHLTPLK